MCTVVLDHRPGEPLRILALRDEIVGREFDLPGAWWPDQPTVIGGRDRLALGTWCASDLESGVTALVLNRTEKREGTPSRGVLPLAAVSAGAAWTDDVDHSEMAAFNLVLAGPDGVLFWTWDGADVTRRELGAGLHMITSRGADTDDARTLRFAPEFDGAPDWVALVETCTPSNADDALVVRHEVVGADGVALVFATVFGQLITAAPGTLDITFSTAPWEPGTWTRLHWSS